ncbi:unnamed protein product [Rotaria socialis]|uniref:B box-type domain-containing protein n=2 Tax=Rotaria socialis TaxID=392032 RepID=A0A818HP26_9BILA|nr:unnamed protein product [Rotaria socialis]CAF3511859.1 unnamed protein product [Rotaria socialis]CAF4116498.1 unnamed protein product [Rotaria socialis]CAF4310341.1 unnamed protein product [Rotaria socialis]
MATASQATTQRPSSSIKLPCATCAKPIGIVRCEGCLKLFCRTDLNEHRNQLSKQLEEITVEHDLFQQTLNQSTADPRSHALISRINAWEKESKNKIKQAAEEARCLIENQAIMNTKQISTRFREMTDRLKKEQKEDTYDERDLKRWKEQLEQLKENFLSPSSVVIEEAPENFIAKILVKDLETLGKKFEQAVGHPGINEEGEYSGGIHNIRLKVEQYANGLMFFGVNSKSTPLNVNNLTAASSYGWTAGPTNIVYKSGQALVNNNDYISDFQTNDIVELELDCYRRHIHMRNHRSNKQYELQIELEKCPFPWMFHFGFSTNGDRLRIVE